MSKSVLNIEKLLEAGTVSKKKIALEQLSFIYNKSSDFWKKDQEKKLLDLFHTCSKTVKAYKEFLKKSTINPEKIKTYDDFDKVPSISKNNYLRSYPWEKLCVDGSLNRQSLVLTSTSGSTGRPFYFPRNGMLDGQSSIYHQMFLQNSNVDIHKSTLVLVCFGMGV